MLFGHLVHPRTATSSRTGVENGSIPSETSVDAYAVPGPSRLHLYHFSDVTVLVEIQ